MIALVCTLFVTSSALAQTTSLLPFQTMAKDQGASDHCAFYAVTALFESALKITFNKEFDISEKNEVHRSKVVLKQRPEVEFGDTYLLLQNFANGYEFETEDGRKFSYRAFKFHHLTKMWDSRPWSAILAEQLKLQRSVVITLKVSPNYINDKTGAITYNQEIDQKCQRQEIPCGGHAVLLVGYNPEKKVFLFKNSWGPNWGQNGFGFVSAEHVDLFSDQPVTGYFDKILSPSLKEQP